ncbi:MAG: hypothetical protein J6L90_01715 [Clostridia bacterium]|nr:hypothetical protein [Clostridia bacterium]
MEQIFTIPVNEEFDACKDDKSLGCPFCRLYRRLQRDELDIILGASMMEPDIRIRTNEEGFCGKHYGMMLVRKRMLGMGLILESHLNELKKKVGQRALLGDVSAPSLSHIGRLNGDCYVCGRIKRNLDAMISTAVYLYERDDEFRDKFKFQPYFCLPHYEEMIRYATKRMNKKLFRELFDTAQKIEKDYLDTLSGDVSWFCKKFDYNYQEEPWYNSKDSVVRAIKFLSGAMDDED